MAAGGPPIPFLLTGPDLGDRCQIIAEGSQLRQAHRPLSTVLRAPDTRMMYHPIIDESLTASQHADEFLDTAGVRDARSVAQQQGGFASALLTLYNLRSRFLPFPRPVSDPTGPLVSVMARAAEPRSRALAGSLARYICLSPSVP